MKLNRIGRIVVCLLLICCLTFHAMIPRAEATAVVEGIAAISSVLGPVGTVAAVSVIALGLWAGANPDDFDNVVDGVSAHLSEIGSNMKDGFVQMLQVTDSAGAKQLYVAAEILENVRSYLFGSGAVSQSVFATSHSFTYDGNSFTASSSVPFEIALFWRTGFSNTGGVSIAAFCPTSSASSFYVNYNGSQYKGKVYGDYLVAELFYSNGSPFTSSHPVTSLRVIHDSTALSTSSAFYTSYFGAVPSPYYTSLNVSLGVLSNTSIVDDVSVYDSTWNANQLRVAVANPENNEPNYKVYLPVPLPSNYEDLHSVTQSDVLTGSITGVPDLGEDEEYVIEELPIVDGYQGVIVSPSDTQSGTQSGTTAGAVTLPGWLSDGINNLLQGLKDILSGILALPAAIAKAIWDALPAWLTEGVSNMVMGLRDILDAIKALPGAIAEAMADVITGALTKAFAISDTFVATKVEALTLKYPYLDTFLALGADLKAFFLGLGTTPPVIYINLGASEGSYNIGGQEIFMDLSWYARYKPTMDAVIGGFIWLWLAWRIYLSIPGIISGASGVWGSITRHSERSMKNNSKENSE